MNGVISASSPITWHFFASINTFNLARLFDAHQPISYPCIRFWGVNLDSYKQTDNKKVIELQNTVRRTHARRQTFAFHLSSLWWLPELSYSRGRHHRWRWKSFLVWAACHLWRIDVLSDESWCKFALIVHTNSWELVRKKFLWDFLDCRDLCFWWASWIQFCRKTVVLRNLQRIFFGPRPMLAHNSLMTRLGQILSWSWRGGGG